MAEHAVLSIPIAMIDPNKRSIVAEASAIQAVVYNKELIAPEKVPNTWEDFLRPELKGKKLSIDQWDSFAQIPGWYDMIEKAFGLPQAEKLR